MARPYGYWTRDRIIRALQQDARRRGRPPKFEEWARAHRRRWWPANQTVVDVFGSWRAGVEAARLEARGRGKAPLGDRCGRGHDLTDPANLAVYGGRVRCSACQRISERERKARRRRKGLCKCGRKRAPGRVSCAVCLARGARRRRAG